jgi:beta-glucanase (GH16 family)
MVMPSFPLGFPFRQLAIIPALLLVAACGGGNDDPAQGGELTPPIPETTGSWQLVWEDEFDGNALDASSWEIQVGNGESEGLVGWGNNELQFYEADNVTVADGVLVIEARQEATEQGFDYTSGRIRTQGKVDFTYGRVEGRIKVPSGQGLWSAFWLLGSDPSPYGRWPAKGEIDIMEKFLPGFFSSAIHFGSYGPQGRFLTESYDDFDVADEFHVYAVEWDAEFIRFFIDGQNFYTINKQSYYNYYYAGRNVGFVEGGDSAPFDADQHIILNLAVGGNLPGTPSDPSVFPARMEVDYVRLYQCPVDSATGKGCEDSIDPIDPFINFEVAAEAPQRSSYSLYSDGVLSLFPDTELERGLALAVFDNGGAFSATEVSTDEGGVALELRTSGGGNVSITDPEGSTFRLTGMGRVAAPASTADFKFRAKVITADTDMDGTLQVKFDSGFPDVAFAEIPLTELPQDEWGLVSVPVEEILLGGQGAFGGGPADVNALVNLVTFEVTSAGVVQINGLQLDCGGPNFCGIEATATGPLPVFDGEVAAQWDRGIVAFDTVVGGNYSEAEGNHVSWRTLDSGDAERGKVIETTFSDSGASGLTFIGSDSAIDLNPWADGELVFDVKVLSNPRAFPIVYKLDGPNGGADSTTGDQSLGVLPVGEWQTVRVPVASLAAKGLDISAVSAFVLFPTFAGQDVVFQWGNVRFEPTVSVVPATVAVPIDFEASVVSYSFANFEGGAAGVIPNPDISGGNGSAQVAQFQKFAGATFAGSVLLLDEPVDFSTGEVFSLKVWSSRPANLTFKLEGLNIERVLPLAGAGWETVEADFSGETGTAAVEGLTFILDNGTAGDAAGDAAAWTYYVDDISLQSGLTDPTLLFGSDFENLDPQATVIGAGWRIFANIFNANGSFAYNYGPFDAPNGTGGFTSVATGQGGFEQGSQHLNTFSDYNNNDAHGSGQTVESIAFQQYTVQASDEGTLTFSFDARLPAVGGVDAAAGASAAAFIQVLDPNNGFAETLRMERNLTADVGLDWASFTLELPINGAEYAGQLVQFGFLNRASNYAASAVLYDNMLFRLLEADEPDPEAPPTPDAVSFVFADDFEGRDSGSNQIGGGWLGFVTVRDAEGNFIYNYGTFAAPNGTNAISSFASGEEGADQGSQYLNVFSDYNNGDAHGSGTQVLETLVFREFTIAEGDSGSYRLVFDAKRPSANALEAPAIGFAFVKILDPANGFATVLFETVDTSVIPTDTWGSQSIAFSINAAEQTGRIIQVGFGNTVSNYGASGIYYDNVVVEPFAPSPAATFEFTDDLEGKDASAGAIGDGWLGFVTVTDGGNFLYNYGTFAAPNGTNAISSVTFGEAGAEQGVQYLNVFSDYNNNGAHGSGTQVLETSVFREFTMVEGDSGTFRFSFDVKRPSAGGLEAPSTAAAFVKILDPANGFATVLFETVDTSSASVSNWARLTIEITLDGAEQAGRIIQFGFNNFASNYAPSGVYYDNIAVERVQ